MNELKNILLAAAILLPLQVAAQWSINPAVNTPVCTSTNNQQSPVSVSDGAGGAIIVWQDKRGGSDWDVFVQRLNASGVAQWTANGVVMAGSSRDEMIPRVVSDGSGGAIIVWEDHYSVSDYDVVTSRVNASGTQLWTTSMSFLSSKQEYPQIVADGSGGAIITWDDDRSVSTGVDVYAQKVNASGVVQWPTDGVALVTAASGQQYPTIAGDGAGGAIVAWMDFRAGSSYQIYARRINSSGVAQWAADGVKMATSVYGQMWPVIISDGVGGGIVAWDYLQPSSSDDIYVQRVSSSGSPLWGGSGVAACAASGGQFTPVLVSDGVSGAIIAWYDSRSGSDVYAQRVSAGGTALWTADGVAISAAPNSQLQPSIVGDGIGGAIITWTDDRNIEGDIYAQHVNASGSALWMVNGIAISTAAGDQSSPTIVTDGANGAIIAWEDRRPGTTYDIYAQNVDRFGYLSFVNPTLTSVRDVRGDQGGKVTVAWNRSYPDSFPNTVITYYSIWRGVTLGALIESANIITPDQMRMDFDGKAYRVVRTSAGTTNWEWVGNIPAHYLSGYSFTSPTLSDSSASGVPYFKFFVSAQTAGGFVFWDSNVDSGYSVDNLPPSTPLNPGLVPLSNGPLRIKWDRNRVDPDVSHYTTYRSTIDGFPVADSTRFRFTADTTLTDSTTLIGVQYYYRITAVDIHGNESVPTVQLGDQALPIQLASFTATVVGQNHVRLEWMTLSEVNNYGFEAQRSADSTSVFPTIPNSFIPGHGTTAEPHTYSFVDSTAYGGHSFYRLKQIDLNGTITFGPVVSVDVATNVRQGEIPKEFALAQNYPNPFNPSTTISYQLPTQSHVALKVYDVVGREVATLVNGVEEPGYKSMQWNAAGAATGVYFYQVRAGEFSQTKKLILLR